VSETFTLMCLECAEELTITADGEGSKRAYELGWGMLRTYRREGQLCPAHSARWLRRKQARRDLALGVNRGGR
jgi:hypothetical protein